MMIIDEFELIFNKFGVNPIIGRIFGLLLSSNQPLSLVEIAERLSLSKASISIKIRILLDMEYCRKLPISRDRQHRYTLQHDYISKSFQIKMVEEQNYIHQIDRLSNQLKESNSLAGKRLKELKEFQQLVIRKQREILNEWEEIGGEL